MLANIIIRQKGLNIYQTLLIITGKVKNCCRYITDQLKWLHLCLWHCWEFVFG